MSTLGGPYKYDVFFSYGWAVGTTGDTALRDWCRVVADTLQKLLSVTFNRPDSQFRYYLDRDETQSGDQLGVTLRDAAENSGIFVAMVSNHYDTEWCKKEIRWFLDKFAETGATDLAERICILRVGDGYWPDELKDAAGHPLLFIDLCNESGPMDLASFMLSRTMPGLAPPIETAALEIADKLKRIRKKLDAAAEYRKSLDMLEHPLVFLEGEIEDQRRWSECSSMLQSFPSIVFPVQGPKPATLAANVELSGCDCLAMLRTRFGDEIAQRIKSAYLYRRQIYREKKLTLPWVLLDDLDDPPPESSAFGLPRVKLGDGWIADFKKAWQGTR